MLDEKTIKNAESNLRNYLDQGLIKKQEFNKIIYDTYIRNHRESLSLANKIFQENMSSLWVVVISYYSMFYIANAVLYKIGYKVGDKIAHKVTSDALIVYIRHKLKKSIIESYQEESIKALSITDNLLDLYNKELTKRSRFQYETTEEIKKSKAETSLKRAKDFSLEIEKLLV